MVDDLHRNIIRLPHHVTNQFRAVLLPHKRLFISYWSDPPQNMIHLSYQLEQQQVQQPKEITSNWTNQIQKQFSKLSIRNISIMMDNKGDLIQFLSIISENQLLVLYSESPRYGKDWSPFIRLNSTEQYWEIKNRGIILEYGQNLGRIIVPVYDLISNRIFMLFSQNNGRSWSSSLFIEPSLEKLDNFDEVHGYQLADLLDQVKNQSNILHPGTYDPLVLEGPEGQLLCICRQSGERDLYYTKSFDSGETWDDLEICQTLKIDVNSPFDGITLRKSTKELSSIALIVGLSTINNQIRLALFTIDFEMGIQIERLVIESDIHNIHGLQMIQDENGSIHIFYVRENEKMNWIDFDPKILQL